MTTKTVVAAIAVTFLAALLFGQASDTDSTLEWEMLTQNVAVGAAGGQWPGAGSTVSAEVYLYNKRTGTVYVRGTCDDSPCFFRLGMSDERDGLYTAPEPTRENGANPY